MIKGILFDKDGTLIDFKTIWIPVTKDTADMICKNYQYKGEQKDLLECIGIKGDEIDSDGLIASKTAEDIAIRWYDRIRPQVSIQLFIEEVKVGFLLKTYENIEFVQIVEGVKEVLRALKNAGFHLGIATADTKEVTELMLKKLEIEEFFEFVGADDGVTPAKPHPAHLENFCEKFGLTRKEVAVVGDTICDMQFGKDFGAYTIGVLSGTGEGEKLQEYANCILPSVADLLPIHLWQQ